MSKLSSNGATVVSVNYFCGRSHRLVQPEADVEEISCSLSDCPLRERGICLYVGCSGLAEIARDAVCPYGSVRKVACTAGDSSGSASSPQSLKRRYEKNPLFNALSAPSSNIPIAVAKIGAHVMLGLPYVRIEYDPEHALPEAIDCGYRQAIAGRRVGRDQSIVVYGGGYSSYACTFLPISAVDETLFVALADIEIVPQRRHSEYRTLAIPIMMEELKEALPDVYAKVIEKDSSLACMTVDYRGRNARILTLRDGIKLGSKKNPFRLDIASKTLRCDVYTGKINNNGIGTVAARGEATVVLSVAEGDSIEVLDNSWVIPGKTQFV